MKKLLLSSVSLLLFSASLLIFQMSCKKEAQAQTGANYTLPVASTTKLGGIIVGSGLTITSKGTLSVTPAETAVTQISKILFAKSSSSKTELWTANYDGTGQTKINITLPAGKRLGKEAKLSPDGKTVFFIAFDTNNKAYLYTCKLNGTAITLLVDGSSLTTEGVTLSGAY